MNYLSGSVAVLFQPNPPIVPPNWELQSDQAWTVTPLGAIVLMGRGNATRGSITIEPGVAGPTGKWTLALTSNNADDGTWNYTISPVPHGYSATGVLAINALGDTGQLVFQTP
jgi:hypothetical protein